MLLNFKQKQLFEKAKKFQSNKEFQKAIKIYLSLLKRFKNNPELLFLIGTANIQAGNDYEGIKFLKIFLDLKPNNPSALLNIGNALKNLKKFNEALSYYNLAINYSPSFADAYNNRGIVLGNLKRYNEAIISYDKAIKINNNYFFAYNNRGVALKKLNYLEEAILSFSEAIRINPNFVDPYNNRGNVYKNLKLYDKALLDYESVLRLKPSYEYILGKILQCKMFLNDWQNFDQIRKKINNDIIKELKVVEPFAYLALEDKPHNAKLCNKIFINDKFKNIKESELDKLNNKKPKIGYFSSDFHNHPVLHLMLDVFKNHNKSKFDIYGFSIGGEKQDKWRNEVIKYFNNFFKIDNFSDDKILNLAKDLKLDIAIDLNGLTKNNRCNIFLKRLAPTQINFLGYPGSTGLKNLDYIIGDETVIPNESFEFYTEKVLHLPGCFQPNRDLKEIQKKKLERSELGIPKESFVYCCFNNNYKITPYIFDSWIKILRKVKNSVLWISNSNEISKQNLKKELKKNDIDTKRLIFAHYISDHEEHLKRISLADLFLDTFPYNAHTTASDAIRMEVPILTLAGKSFVSRVAMSLLKNLGLSEMITYNINDYIDLAIEIGSDNDKFNSIKNKLKKLKTSSNIFNSLKYTQNLENLYLELLKK